MATAPSLKSVPVELDAPRAIAFTQLACYRMGTLEPRPFTLGDLTDRRRSYAALVAWLWACLTAEHHGVFPSPESLAPHVTNARVGPLMKALRDAVDAAFPPEKNGDGSTRKPSRASSSA